MTNQPLALWLTGLPASGKTTIANFLAEELRQRKMGVQILDSDQLRQVLTPYPSYTDEERDWFYRTIAFIGKLMVENGVTVIFAATAHKRIYRQTAREYLPHLIEVYVCCPLEICMKRDQKGIYKKALAGEASSVPGIQDLYEEPEVPAVIVDTEKVSPLDNAQTIIAKLVELGHIVDDK